MEAIVARRSAQGAYPARAGDVPGQPAEGGAISGNRANQFVPLPETRRRGHQKRKIRCCGLRCRAVRSFLPSRNRRSGWLACALQCQEQMNGVAWVFSRRERVPGTEVRNALAVPEADSPVNAACSKSSQFPALKRSEEHTSELQSP